MNNPVVIGDCTLYLGDCRDILAGLPKVDAVVTDPPYGVNHHPGKGRMSKVAGGIVGDLQPPDIRWIAQYPSVVWGGNNFCDQLPRSTGWLVWDKTNTEMCEHSQAELAWTNAVRTIRLHRENYSGFMRGRDGWFHQHQKPVALFKWCLGFLAGSTIILDPYMGSGTTGLACVSTGKQFIGIEISETDHSIACRRIEDATKQGKLPLVEREKAEQMTLESP